MKHNLENLCRIKIRILTSVSERVKPKYFINRVFWICSFIILASAGAIVMYHMQIARADTSSNEPSSCPSGFIPVPGNSAYGTAGGFCVMKYEAEQGSNSIPISTGATAPWTDVTQIQATNYSKTACSGCHLITENEWLTIANNVMNVASNWTGGAVGSGSLFSGNIANSAASAPTSAGSGTSTRTLTLSNGQVIWDLAGNAPEWTQGTIAVNRSSVNGSTSAEYNTLNQNNMGDFSPRLLPSYNDTAAASFTSSNGIGKIITSYSASSSQPNGFLRGGNVWQGYWPSGSNGVFSLVAYSPSSSYVCIFSGAYVYFGFRVAE